MNMTYAPTASGYIPPGILPSLLQETLPPTAQIRAVKSSNRQTSIPRLLGTTLSAMVVASSAYALPPPTFIKTTQYITPERVSVKRENNTLFGYSVAENQQSAISDYLKMQPIADYFVRNVARIIDQIYGVGVIRSLRVLDDLDTGKPIMELTIESNLPLNDEFMQKDKALFQQIELSKLVEGLQYVVVSQG